jgi:L-seryl-tRNA(Ser) seleniumtransferase
MRLSSFEKMLRQLPVPVIGRIENDRFLLDVRTIQDQEIVELIGILIDVLSGDDSD